MKILLLAAALVFFGPAGPAPASSTRIQASDEPPKLVIDAKRRWRMERNDGLKQIVLEEVATDEGFIFYIQKTLAQPENYAKQVIATHLPWLVATEKAFDEVTGLTGEREPVAVVVLASSGDLANYTERVPAVCHLVLSTPYNAYLATLTLVNLRAKTKTAGAIRQRTLIHSTVHGLWQAHAHKLDKLPGPLWLVEGLADYIARGFGKTPAELDLAKPMKSQLESVVRICRPKPAAQKQLATFDELLALDPFLFGTQEETNWYHSLPKQDYESSFYGRAAEVALLYQFLHDGDNGKLRAGLQKFVRLALGGAKAPGALQRALGLKDFSDCAVSYWQFIFEAYKTTNKEFDIEAVRGPREVALAIALLGASIKEPIAPLPRFAAAEPVAVADPLAPAPRQAAPIAEPVFDAAAVRAEALFTASEGRLAEAIASLEALGEDGVEELERLRAVAELRRDYLQRIVESGSRLRLQIDGKKANAKVLAVTDTTLTLEATKRVPSELPITAWPLAELLSKTTKARPPTGTPEQRAILGALLSSDKWQRYLRKDLGRGTDLEATLEAFPELLATGAAVAGMRALVDRTRLEPPDPAGTLAAVRALAAHSADHAFVRKYKPFVLDRARQALAETATDQAIVDSLHATSGSLEDGTLQLTYDFLSADELEDFVLATGGPTDRTVGLVPSALPESRWSHTIQSGALRTRGNTVLQHIAPLTEPVRIEYLRITYYTQDVEYTFKNGMVLTICDDLAMSYLYSAGYATVVAVVSKGAGNFAEQEPTMPYLYETPYWSSLSYADGLLTAECDGAEPLSLEVSTGYRGYTLLMFHSDAQMGLQELQIEGQLDDAGRRELAQAYADGELEAMGLL